MELLTMAYTIKMAEHIKTLEAENRYKPNESHDFSAEKSQKFQQSDQEEFPKSSSVHTELPDSKVP